MTRLPPFKGSYPYNFKNNEQNVLYYLLFGFYSGINKAMLNTKIYGNLLILYKKYSVRFSIRVKLLSRLLGIVCNRYGTTAACERMTNTYLKRIINKY